MTPRETPDDATSVLSRDRDDLYSFLAAPNRWFVGSRQETAAQDQMLPLGRTPQTRLGFDVLICDACEGPRKILAFITQPGAIQKILEHCGLARDEVLIAPAHSPPGFEDVFFA